MPPKTVVVKQISDLVAFGKKAVLSDCLNKYHFNTIIKVAIFITDYFPKIWPAENSFFFCQQIHLWNVKVNCVFKSSRAFGFEDEFQIRNLWMWIESFLASLFWALEPLRKSLKYVESKNLPEIYLSDNKC